MDLRWILVTLTFCAFSEASNHSHANAIILRDCPPGINEGPETNLLTVKEFAIKGCDKEPCVFIKTGYFEANALCAINFTAKTLTRIAIALTPLGPIEIIRGDMCAIIIGGCDNLKPGTDMVIKVKRRIDEWIPPYRGPLRFIIKDEIGKSLFCTETTIIIKEKNLDVGDLIEGLGK